VCRVGPAASGFDLVVMSDLLYFDKSHSKLIESVELLLTKTRDARLWVAAGKYTPEHVCSSFLELGTKAGLIWEEVPTSGNWEGDTTTGTYTVEELQVRKNNSNLWIGRWNDGRA
jgi:EEF1A N-terminal glycine/lysine methyltransferase